MEGIAPTCGNYPIILSWYDFVWSHHLVVFVVDDVAVPDVVYGRIEADRREEERAVDVERPISTLFIPIDIFYLSNKWDAICDPVYNTNNRGNITASLIKFIIFEFSCLFHVFRCKLIPLLNQYVDDFFL